MKKYLIALLFALTVYAQTNDDQKIELPDFVITGVKEIDFPAKDKIKPELSVKVDNIELQQAEDKDPSIPDVINSNAPELLPPVFKTKDFINGRIKLGAGIYTLPEGIFQLSGNTENFLINGKIYGQNVTDYVNRAGITSSGAGLLSEYNVGNNSTFLPGLKLKFSGNFERESAGFFASDTASFKRLKEMGDISFGVSNFWDENINYSVNYQKLISRIKEIGLKEDQDNFEIFASGGISEFTVKGDVTFSKVKYSNDTISNSVNFNKVYAAIVSDLIPRLILEGGINYFWANDASRIKLNLSAEFYIGNGITIYGRFNPKAYLHTNRMLLSENRYFLPDVPLVPVVNEKNSLEFSAKYQLATYVEINAGYGLKTFSSKPFYLNDKGIFRLGLMNSVKENYLFANCLFHNGPYGKFYAGAKINSTTFPGGNKLPYSPSFFLNLDYTYSFLFDLDAGINLKYTGSSYSDILNTIENPAFAQVDICLLYKISPEIDALLRFENLLNRKNYIWGIYEQKPVDIIAGVEYHW